MSVNLNPGANIRPGNPGDWMHVFEWSPDEGTVVHGWYNIESGMCQLTVEIFPVEVVVREQVARNVQAAALSLSPEIISRLDAATNALKQALGPNADYWQGEERSRIR